MREVDLTGNRQPCILKVPPFTPPSASSAAPANGHGPTLMYGNPPCAVTLRRRPWTILPLIVSVSALTSSIILAQNPAVDSKVDGQNNRANGKEQWSAPKFLNEYCVGCHNADERESGIRVDHLDGTLPEPTIRLWEDIREQIDAEAMPPDDESQPTADQRQRMVEWIDEALQRARARKEEVHGTVRRLTVEQYRNTLQALLGIEDDFATVLPPDGVSKDGFTNDAATLSLSPLQVESWFSIAEKAIDAALVDVNEPPAIQNFRMDLGEGINPEPLQEKLILGANSHLLNNADFLVTELTPEKPFPAAPYRMKRNYRFHEGYQGNSTVRGWREYDSIYHSVFACMRGNGGYPKGKAYETVESGLLLRPAIPTTEIFGESSTYGPQANFKIALRELPDHGRFRVRVKAAKYADGLLLTDEKPIGTDDDIAGQVVVDSPTSQQHVEIPAAGIYQVDVVLSKKQIASSDETTDEQDAKQKKKEKRIRRFTLTIDSRQFTSDIRKPAFVVLRLRKGKLPFSAKFEGQEELSRVVLTPLDASETVAKDFVAFENRVPKLGVFLGLRRDCGHTFRRVEQPTEVTTNEISEYVFEGAINNYPRPHVQQDNDNYLAGVHEISVRCDYTDGRDTPRLLLQSVEFEGPFYETWPPKSHRNILIESEHPADSEQYATEVIRQFATRAYRRPMRDAEIDSLLAAWRDATASGNTSVEGLKKALTVALTSPPFLFLVEQSEGPEPEQLGPYELASKLSYFLWNGPPDEELLGHAESQTLRSNLATQVERMIADERFDRFASRFAAEWLSLDKFDVVETDRKKYRTLSSSVKRQLRQEPSALLKHLFRNNHSAERLIRSDFVVANESVANYYGLSNATESGFEFVPIKHDNAQLGGVLSLAAVLAGLSDGREANPVKRGAWFARKIIADPPEDPPPNVPELEDTTELSLRERLERHRNVKGCIKCHEGIDPWGLAFEQFDAGGRFQGSQIDAESVLPDGTTVKDLNELRDYLLQERMDQVAYSLLKHLATYAMGRPLTYGEDRLLKQQCLELKSNHYPMKDMIQQVVQSDLFLTK